MTANIILASGSEIRATLLRNSGVLFQINVPRIDEESIKASLVGEGYATRDIADALADAKSRKIAVKRPESWVIGSDQIVEIGDKILDKPKDKNDAADHLSELSGRDHTIHSSAVIYHDATAQWRFVGKAKMKMRDLSPTFINEYVDENWDEIQHCVGCYQIEASGARLFSQVQGDHFHVMGFPLLEVLNFLTLRKVITG